MDLWPVILLVVLGLALYWFNLSSRARWRDLGNGDEFDLRPPGEPGNRGDTDMTGWRW
jgi:hypothetical protein